MTDSSDKKISKKKLKKHTSEEPNYGNRSYIHGLGRRKRAIAQVRLYEKGKGIITVNNKSIDEYFPNFKWQDAIKGPLIEAHAEKNFDTWVKVRGGGVNGQAEAVQLGIARALIKHDEQLRKPIKAKGFLSRDPREKERKKPGLKRARRSPQWSKR